MEMNGRFWCSLKSERISFAKINSFMEMVNERIQGVFNGNEWQVLV